MKKVFSFNSELYKVTGVQKVMMDIHHAVCDDCDAKIVGTIPYEKVNENHHISRNEYIQWKKNPFSFYKSIVIVHERKFLLFFWLLNHILFQQIKIVYVHHNIFHNQRLLSVMPKTVVSISDRSTQNLIEYFKVPKEHIHKIHNCVEDVNPLPHNQNRTDKVVILYPARINGQKQQLEIVKQLHGKLDKRIVIKFAGVGPYFEQLKELVKNDENFEVLGFRSDIYDLLKDSDYMMLYSVHEGLPISLIEASMFGTPIICSDVGGNAEICHNGKNGWVLCCWEDLISILNQLPYVSHEKYMEMSRNGRHIYESYFKFEVFKNKYFNLIKSLQ